MDKPDILHILVHIPKTAGERIKRNIEASLPRNSFIHAHCSQFARYFDIPQKKNSFYQSKDHFLEYMNSLSPNQKRKIRCVAGHDSFYGIHQFFSHLPRYTVFLREPMARTLSLYNYERTIHHTYSVYKGPLNFRQEKASERINNNFLVNGRVPEFEEWLTESYDKKNPFYYSMAKYLKHLGFLAEGNNQTMQEEALDKFHFIGITEKYDEDAFFLYHEMGVGKFDFDPHASTPFLRLNDLNKQTINRMEEINAADASLYEAALRKNEEFKKRHPYFYKAVKKKQVQHKFFLFRQAIAHKLINFFHSIWFKIKLKLKCFPLLVRFNQKIKKYKPEKIGID